MANLANLPEELQVAIAERVAAGRSWPDEDLANLRSTCRVMRRACDELSVFRCLNVETFAYRGRGRGWLLMILHLYSFLGNPKASLIVGILDALDGGPWWWNLQVLEGMAAGGSLVASFALGLFTMLAEWPTGVENVWLCSLPEDGWEAYMEETTRLAWDFETWRWSEEVRDMWAQSVRARVQRCPLPQCGRREGWNGRRVFCADGCRLKHLCLEFFGKILWPEEM